MRLWRRWASDATVDGELDALQIVYLRFVHLYDYYSGEEFSDEVEMVKLRGFAHLRRKAKEVGPQHCLCEQPQYPFRCSLLRSIGFGFRVLSRPAESLDPPLCPISPWLSAPASRCTTASSAERGRARTWKRSSLQSGASWSTQRRAHAKRSRWTAPRTTGRRRRSLSGWVSRPAPQQGRTARRMGFPAAGWVPCRTGHRALHRAWPADARQEGWCGFAGEFFKTAIKEIGEGKFGCSVADCDKKFRGADFVKANLTSDSNLIIHTIKVKAIPIDIYPH